MYCPDKILFNNLSAHTLRREQGLKDEVFVCLHGWLDNVGSFIPLMEQNPSIPWLCVDLIGHGQSMWREEGQYYYFHDYITDFMEWIECQNDLKIHLVGHSLGAAIVSILCGLLPEKISSCVLLDGIGPLVSDDESIAEQWRLALYQYRNSKPRRTYPNLDILVKARMKKHNIKQSSCELLVEHGHKFCPETEEYYWSFDPRLLNLSPLQMTQQQVLSIFKHINAPTLLINAKQGYPFEGPHFEKRKQTITTLQEIKIDGGHHVHMDQPKLVYDLMLEFYQSHNILT